MSGSRPDFPFRIEFPKDLPISARAPEILDTLAKNQILILAGETGSGKTTQIPKMCLAAGLGTKGRIACTQPRRVAALSISRRVAEELQVDWGKEVGCKVRFSDQTSKQTVIKFLTDGMLLAEVQGDPLLREYDTVIIDEAHERSLNIDFLLGHLRQLRHGRPDLKIIITSATIDTEAFSKAFDDAPVIQVSGRTFPVEVIYAPLDQWGSDAAEGDEETSKAEALHYIDGALESVERIVEESDHGDILVFLPAERDIRELKELLEGRKLRGCEVVPLYGRLSNAEQQRVFATSQRRKVVVATNIAETSLTIPGIRFVVDAGLARISRYAPGSRTRRLPIEPIAQSSADQRKGRSGRVAEGVCIRLYSEKDYNERPRFAQPEIQRANLADVILRMKAFGLGDIERFPFINMPATKSIRAGYSLLEELGAVEPEEGGVRLTSVGRELARLPVDPTVGRMILQARQEKCLREVLVIAAGLSIQDPRERPLDKQEKADAAHRRFLRHDSDFLTLLAIWDAFHDEMERLSQSRLRRFCHEHFLSYTRLREWRDIHAQLMDVLKERSDFRMSSVVDGLPPDTAQEKLQFGSPAYRAIHRSILAGLLGNIATRDDENGGYKATHERRVSLFPGSVLFQKDERTRGPRAPKPDKAKKPGPPRWIMAAEIMETSRLYARTCARLDPLWVLDLGSHLVKATHSEPFWMQEGGRVLVKQRTRLYGLELESKAVGYGRIDPEHSTEIFIREGLVNDTLTWPFDFLAHNRDVRERLESLLTRTRDSRYMNLDEGVYRFYAERIKPWIDAEGNERGVSAVAELVDLVRERRRAEPEFLKMKVEDLRDPEELTTDQVAFPETLPLENRVLELGYTYKPGSPEDGVTLQVPVKDAAALNQIVLDWAVPGHLEAKVEHYLRGSPKEIRRLFVPLAETVKRVARALEQRHRLVGGRETLVEALSAYLREAYQVNVSEKTWADKPLPDYLQVRVRVVDDAGEEVSASRRLDEVRAAVGTRERAASQSVAKEDPDAWNRARRKFEKGEAEDWVFGDVPSRVDVGELNGVPVYAYPGLRAGERGVALRLFRSEEEAGRITPSGLEKLMELGMKYELAWLQKDLRRLRELGALPATLQRTEVLQNGAYVAIRKDLCAYSRVVAHIIEKQGISVLTEPAFRKALDEAKSEAKFAVTRLLDLLREILTLRQALLVHPTPPAELLNEIAALLPANFLEVIPLTRLRHYPRYLRGWKIRADRWRQNPQKDAERVAAFAKYESFSRKLRSSGQEASPLRWLVEEFRVSVFAQEIGTAEPVSAQKLDQAIQSAQGAITTPGEGVSRLPTVPTKPAPRPIELATKKSSQPLKSLGALDRLFNRQ